MGHKNSKGAVSIVNYKGRIRLRWRYQSKRYSLNHALYNKTNLLQAKKLALLIEEDAANDRFDYSLNRYKGKPESPAVTEKSIVEYFEEWTTSYKQIDCELHTNYNSVRNMLKKWGETDQSNILYKFNSETFCGATYNRRLTMLKDFIKWLIRKGIWTFHPLQDVNPKRYKKPKQTTNIDLLEKICKLIDVAVRKSERYSPYD